MKGYGFGHVLAKLRIIFLLSCFKEMIEKYQADLILPYSSFFMSCYLTFSK